MKEVDYIVGIYNQFNPFPEDSSYQGYYLLYLLDQKGFLSTEEAIKIYNEKFKLLDDSKAFKKGYIGPFESLETINQFAFLLCENLNAQKVSLLSVPEYNTILESTEQAFDFHRDLLEKGNVLENIDHKKKGFFKRLFN
jgi:hypothetical protein